MDLFSSEFFAALAAIIVIDLVLAGDNAIVIALAARNLEPRLRKVAIVWGTVGAIAVRAAMTLIVVWLLQIPGLMFCGGLMLVWIASYTAPWSTYGRVWVNQFPYTALYGPTFVGLPPNMAGQTENMLVPSRPLTGRSNPKYGGRSVRSLW